jgi:anti-sigma-K factor RskA
MNNPTPPLHKRAGYRLGADDDREADEFEILAAATLAIVVTPLPPRPDLKAELMDRIDALENLEGARSRPGFPSIPHGLTAAAADSHESRLLTAERKARARWRRPTGILAAAAAAIALFVGGVVAGGTIHHSDPTQTPLTQVIAAPDARQASAPIGNRGGSVSVVRSAELGTSVAVFRDVPPAPSGKTYELWYIRDGAATAAGTVDPSSAVTTKALTGTFRAGDTIALTVEPAGGSKQPTTKPLVTIT